MVGVCHVGIGETVHVRLAALLVASVRRAMPDVSVVHLTDEVTAPIDAADEVQRHAVTGGVALACLELYAAAGAGEWLFVDTDVIVQQDVQHVFDEPFDVAVADRAGTLKDCELGTKFMARMPYNKGAVFSRSPEFWRSAVAACRTMKPTRQQWMGDQQAMNDVIAGGQFRVKVLPNSYNYPPQFAGEHVAEKHICHYKGPRKPWMLGRAA
jgi:hypothetical protein